MNRLPCRSRIGWLFFLYTIATIVAQTLRAQPTITQSVAEIQLALNRLSVLGSVLYVAAHPDDENQAVLAYFAKERLCRTGYLSLTRGSGGQNLIGAEKGDLIGVIRTQELLAARQIDGAEQFFTRAIDFGYTKSVDETLGRWGHDIILSDVVRVIRQFRPDIIITRFPGTGEGRHGQHTAATKLALEAFRLAADSTAFPEQLRMLDTWQPKRLFWNTWKPLMQARQAPGENLLAIDVGKYNALLGLSYTEISALSRSQHKSQGFGASGRRGRSFEYLALLAGPEANEDPLEDIDTGWGRVENSHQVATLARQAAADFDVNNPARSIPQLLRIYKLLQTTKSQGFWQIQKLKEVQNLIRACAGLWLEAIAADYSVVAGDSIKLAIEVLNRSDFPLKLQEVILPFGRRHKELKGTLDSNVPFKRTITLSVPAGTKLSQPYWLKNEHQTDYHRLNDPDLTGRPVNETMCLQMVVRLQDTDLKIDVPILYRWTDRVRGELYRSLEIREPVSVNLDQPTYIFSPNFRSREVAVVVKSNKPNSSGKVRLLTAPSWRISPAEQAFDITKKYGEQILHFTLRAPQESSHEILQVKVLNAGNEYQRGLVEIEHDHIPVQSLFQPARANIVNIDLRTKGENIAYIMGPGDDIPECLRQVGYQVTLLDDDDLQNSSFDNFDVVITGIRAYNTRERLQHVQPQLMDYVHNGGTLIMQYNVSFGLVTEDLGPYRFEISRQRVTLENAAVQMLKPDHQLMNYPNSITAADFENWIQERGLYFAGSWQSDYDTVLSCNDPGEPGREGGLLFAKYGKGVFIYTGYSWFRQLPAGVPGAYRLFANMIAASGYRLNP
jgi:LmbE family N-acetylglucosaminyl deacetylase